MTLDSRRGRIVPPDLDDRTWQDLVNEMRALIPKYAPQWTDHNPSDLGITLIELFAWLGESIIYRLNQTPEKNYLAFLNLLGITRDPAAPARTHLTFTSRVSGPVTVPAGTRAQTADPAGGRPVVFETDEPLVVLPTTLKAALRLPALASGGAVTGLYRNVTPALVGPPSASHLVDVPAGQTVTVYLGFDRAVTAQMSIGLRLYQAVGATPAQLSCLYSTGTAQPGAWTPVQLGDGTEGLRHDGALRLTVPADWAAQRAAGPAAAGTWTTVTPQAPGDAVTEPLFWLALRIAAPTGGGGTPPLTVGIDRLLFNAVSARTALTIRQPEPLGASNGQGFQVFPLRDRPLYRRPGLADPYADLVVQVETGNPPVWQEWTLVEDFPAGAGRVYRIDPVAGEVLFGNFDQQAGTGAGSVPPSGARIRAARYRYVEAGAAGNVGANQVVVLGGTPDGGMPTGITEVNNLGPARDGADEEPIEEAMRRAPEELRIRYRAVTVDDYEFLAREASNDLTVRRCLPPRVHTVGSPPHWEEGDPWEFGGLVRAPGTVNLVIVPNLGFEVPRPEPTPDQIRLVQAYLDARRDLTARLEVVPPRYLPVIVNVEIMVWQQALNAGADRTQIETETKRRIREFLHPTRGGLAGTGWDVGAPVFTSDLFQALMPAQDVGYISVLQVRPDTPVYHFPPLGPGGTYQPNVERPFALSPFGASVRLADYELVCAAADELQLVKTTPVQA